MQLHLEARFATRKQNFFTGGFVGDMVYDMLGFYRDDGKRTWNLRRYNVVYTGAIICR